MCGECTLNSLHFKTKTKNLIAKHKLSAKTQLKRGEREHNENEQTIS